MPAAPARARVGQHPGLAPPVPVNPASNSDDAPTWHVSINDVSVGPIRLEEMAHKIDAGAVSEYSLVWRAGLDDWRPLATVPELMALLHERRHSGPPARSTFSSMPPFVETRSPLGAAAVASPAPAVPRPPSRFPVLADSGHDDPIFPLADSLQPEDPAGSDVSQPPAPIGPEDIFDSSPQLGSYSGLAPTADQGVSVPSAPPDTAAATAEPKRGRSVGILALIIAVIVLSGVVAFLAFEQFGDGLMKQWMGKEGLPRPSAVVAPRDPSVDATADRPEAAVESEEPPAEAATFEGEAAEPEAGDSAEATEAPGEAPAVAEEAEAEAKELVPPPDPRDDSPKIAPIEHSQARPRRRARPAPAPVTRAEETESADNGLSAAEQKILADFGSSGNAAPAQIDLDKAANQQNDKPALDGDAIRSTVSTNKPKLQRCYERAIRGQPSPGAVRLDVSVTVASSGRVKSVTADGEGPGGLAACVEASVRRWRFPASAEGGPARFPIVFSAN